MTSVRKILLGAAAGASILAFSALNASAAVVCNGPVCWHTQEAYEYPPTAGVVVHEDNWQCPGRVPGPCSNVKRELAAHWRPFSFLCCPSIHRAAARALLAGLIKILSKSEREPPRSAANMRRLRGNRGCLQSFPTEGTD
jgi:hypothetical protein